MAAIVLTGGQAPDQETIQQADQEGVPVLMCPKSVFDLAGQVYAAGLVEQPGET
jgi:predicted transcriptional regulator